MQVLAKRDALVEVWGRRRPPRPWPQLYVWSTILTSIITAVLFAHVTVNHLDHSVVSGGLNMTIGLTVSSPFVITWGTPGTSGGASSQRFNGQGQPAAPSATSPPTVTSDEAYYYKQNAQNLAKVVKERVKQAAGKESAPRQAVSESVARARLPQVPLAQQKGSKMDLLAVQILLKQMAPDQSHVVSPLAARIAGKSKSVDFSGVLKLKDQIEKLKLTLAVPRFAELKFQTATSPEYMSEIGGAEPDPAEIRLYQGPASVDPLGHFSENEIQHRRHTGLAAIARREVAVLTLAAYETPLLGHSGPLGTFEIGLPSGASLFELFAHRIRRLEHLAAMTVLEDRQQYKAEMSKEGPSITWFITTSAATHNETQAYFELHRYFGLAPNQVEFVMMSESPVFGDDGKLLMASADSLATSTAGNGAVFEALEAAGVQRSFTARNIRFIHLHEVDNILSLVADPVFIGHAVATGAEITTKAIKLDDPDEQIGRLYIKRSPHGEHMTVLDHSKLSEDVIASVNMQKMPVYGDICSHIFTRAFVHRVAHFQPTYHGPYTLRKKQVEYIDRTAQVKRKGAGIVFERHIFSALANALDSFQIIEVRRDDEYAPVRREASGSDSVSSALDLLSSATKRQINAAVKRLIAPRVGVAPRAPDPIPGGIVEISPLVTYSGEDLDVSIRSSGIKSFGVSPHFIPKGSGQYMAPTPGFGLNLDASQFRAKAYGLEGTAEFGYSLELDQTFQDGATSPRATVHVS